MAFTPQFGKYTTLSVQMAQGASSATLASAVFTNFTNDYLVIDYNVEGSEAMFLCTVTGTAVTSMTLVSGPDVVHNIGAKVAYGFVPPHYTSITDGSGFQTGSASVGIPNTALKWTAWTTGTLTPTGFSGTPTEANGWIRLGNICIIRWNISGTSNTTAFGITLPFAAQVTANHACGRVTDNGSNTFNGMISTTAGSAAATFSTSAGGAGWTGSGTKGATGFYMYEID